MPALVVGMLVSLFLTCLWTVLEICMLIINGIYRLLLRHR